MVKSIRFFAPEWGNTLPFATFCHNVKAAGYDGVEMALPLDPDDYQAVFATLAQFDLELIGQFYQSFESDLDKHARSYETYLRHLAAARPILINCQTGKDYFTFDQNRELFELANRVSAETGIKITHETHLGKALFAAHVCREYLTKLPNIRLALDISHWCNVHESMLDDQAEAVYLALAHTDHIHCRVGHPEGPQVNDPRAPEWASTLDAHLVWWDKIVERHQRANTPLTINTEFGPPNYMPVLPYTQLPTGDQWAINVFMMNLLKERYH